MSIKHRADTPYWRQQGWIVSIVFLASLLVLAGYMAVSHWGDGGTAQASAKPSAVPLGADGRPVGCRTDDSDTAKPRTTPKGVTWKQIDRGKVPVSRTAGPARTTGGMLWCFGHTPLGAVVAAHVIPGALGGEGWEAAARNQLVTGVGQDVYVIHRQEAGEDAGAQGTGRYVGFSLLSYSDTEARVRLLVQNGGQYLSCRVEVQWQDGDWKVVPEATGAIVADVQGVLGNAGFVMWGV